MAAFCSSIERAIASSGVIATTVGHSRSLRREDAKLMCTFPFVAVAVACCASEFLAFCFNVAPPLAKKRGPDLLKSGGSGEDRAPARPAHALVRVLLLSAREGNLHIRVAANCVCRSGQTISDAVHAQRWGGGRPPNKSVMNRSLRPVGKGANIVCAPKRPTSQRRGDRIALQLDMTCRP
jgi:hypothetical protein